MPVKKQPKDTESSQPKNKGGKAKPKNAVTTEVDKAIKSIVKEYSDASNKDTKAPVKQGGQNRQQQQQGGRQPRNGQADKNRQPVQKQQAPRDEEFAPREAAPVCIVALGGVGEIGKNLYVYECGGDMFAIDCGMAFPGDELPGVDAVIPDFSYLEANTKRFKGVVLTHGHEDHIGALSYLLKRINVPIYGTRLTLGIVAGKLKEAGLLDTARLVPVKPRQIVKFGAMSVEFIRVNHSIPDACAMAVHTPSGIIVHTGDFKVDYTPIEGGAIDLCRFAELGKQGVIALLSESTNAERPGFTQSERKVGESFRSIFAGADGKRIIVATFSSNIHRLQQIIDTAAASGRKVAVSGRSMLNTMAVAVELGYIKADKDVLIDIDQVNKYPPEKTVIITTGSQGEPLSALSRMAGGEHRQVNITAEDLIVISATPIPGNEKTVSRVVNDLMKLGADVVYEAMYEVHVSGHACQEELKLILALTKPKFFVPIHGEFKHMRKHAQLAERMGVPEKNIFIVGIGQQLATDGATMEITGSVPAGRVLVDGSGIGDIGTAVLRDRKRLSENGIVIVTATIEKNGGKLIGGPEVFTRGFVYVKESEPFLEESRFMVKDIMARFTDKPYVEMAALRTALRDELGDFIFRKTKRSPMVLPIITLCYNRSNDNN
ncbi:MAG: ribonuclease J [Oscillospiraceae bacterium]|jgi:ribonuclease J|nr:ribonuclease J [Oscillospiraceae bacterium]